MASNTQVNGLVVGVDWGTTNRRAYVLDRQGRLLAQHADDQGILAVGNGNFPASLQALLAQLGVDDNAEVILSGMVGSRNGWQEVPYLDPGQALATLADALVEVESPLPGMRCRIVPGYRATNAMGIPDVMRGEETQIFGVLAEGGGDGWFVLPGTHSKWVQVRHGFVCQIMTFMTGELFSLLSRHGTLSTLKSDDDALPEPFDAGLRAAQHSGFTHAAFGCRALVVTGQMPASDASSYLSGLLIGAELAGIRQQAGSYPDVPVQIVGSPALAARYAEALRFFDIRSKVWPPDSVYLAALRKLAGISSEEGRACST